MVGLTVSRVCQGDQEIVKVVELPIKLFVRNQNVRGRWSVTMAKPVCQDTVVVYNTCKGTGAETLAMYYGNMRLLTMEEDWM